MAGRLVQRGKKGEWCAVFEDGTKGGKRHRRVINLHTSSKRDAAAALARLIVSQRDGMLPEIDKDSKTLGAWLTHWLQTREIAGRAPKTLLNTGA